MSTPIDLPGIPAGMSDGEAVYRILAAEDPFQRFTRYEPSLVPHLARLCHDFSIGELLLAADIVGRHAVYPWPQLRESAWNRLALRFDDDEFELQASGMVTPEELAVRRCMARGDAPTDVLWYQIDSVKDDELRLGLTARLLEFDPHPSDDHLAWCMDRVDERWGDVEVLRALAATAARRGEVPRLAELAIGAVADPFRAAHLLPALVEAEDRQTLAKAILGDLRDYGLEAWLLALLVSRVGPHLPGDVGWDFGDVFDPEGVWVPHLELLSHAGLADSLDADTRRAHPFAHLLEGIPGPHESTQGAGEQIVVLYGGAPPPETAAAPEHEESASPEHEESASPEFEESASPEFEDSASSPGNAGEPYDMPMSPPASSPAETMDDLIVPAPGFDGGGRRGFRPDEYPRPHLEGWEDSSSSERAEPAAEEREVVDDRRLGVDLFLAGRRLQRAVVAGQEHLVQVSIGHGATVSLSTPVGVEFASGVDMRMLPVRFVCGNFDKTEQMAIERDPTRTARVRFSITPTGGEFSAIVIVYNEDQSAVIQAASVTAAAVASIDDEAAHEPSLRIATVPAAALTTGPRGAATVVTDGQMTVASGPELPLPCTVQSAIGQFSPTIQWIEKTAADRSGNPDMAIDGALDGVARAGVRMRTALRLDALAEFERIQVVSLLGQSVLPIELVYDGDPPKRGAKLCAKWEKALEKGKCPTCSKRSGADSTDVVCPLRFWGMSKIIEHAQIVDHSGQDYTARVLRTTESPFVQRPKSALVSVSEKVAPGTKQSTVGEGDSPALVDLLHDIVNAASKFGEVAVVPNWSDWKAAVHEEGPALLIAMPHQGNREDGGIRTPALELGGDYETTFVETHIRRHDDRPGPVLVLLGCNVATEARLISSFASRFSEWSPVVVGTVGEVLADEAQHVATTIVKEMAKAWGRRRRATTIGTVIRDVRRALFAQSRLIGLQLVLHGNADWEMSRKG